MHLISQSSVMKLRANGYDPSSSSPALHHRALRVRSDKKTILVVGGRAGTEAQNARTNQFQLIDYTIEIIIYYTILSRL